MGRVRLLDEAMNTAGYLRICTGGWHVQHLGNVLPRNSGQIGHLKLPNLAKKPMRKGGIWRWEPVRKLLQRIYGWSFDRLHRQ
jgi:hypothetical protein